MARKLDIDHNLPYIPRAVQSGDGRDFVYSTSGSSLLRIDMSGNERLGTYAFPTNAIPEIFATSTPGKVFVNYIDTDSKGFLYLTNDFGDTFSQACTLGDNEGIHIPEVRLMQKGFCEAVINGSTVYIFSEYNINTARTSGGTNDKVRVMISSDEGSTWTKLVEWNTDGTQYMVHFHCVAQDPYTGKIYLCAGDTNPHSAIIEWDTTVGVWADNLSYTALASRAGFRVIHGTQSCRAVDLQFSERYIHYISDTETVDYTGIFRIDKLPGAFTTSRRNFEVENFTHHCGWVGWKMPSGSLCFMDGIISDGPFYQLNVWSSSDDGESYVLVAKFTVRSDLPSTNFLPRIGIAGGRVFIGTNNGAGKNNYDTAVIKETGEPFAGDFPVVIHPVYFVSFIGTNSNAGEGWIPSNPWLTPLYALTSNRITHGSRVILAEGEYDIPSINTAWTTHGRPGYGITHLEGVGVDKTILSGTGSVSSYVVNFAISGVESVISNLTLKSKKMDVPNTVLFVGSATSTGVVVHARNSKIGDKNYDNLSNVIKVFDKFTYKRTTIEGPRRSLVIPGKVGATIEGSQSIYNGGSNQIYIDKAANCEEYNCVHNDYTTTGVSTAGVGVATIVPKVKNSIFYSMQPGALSIKDTANLNETDADIDYNYYATPLSSIANNGGVNSIHNTGSPFADAVFHLQPTSPCLGAGTKISGITTDIEGNTLYPPYNIGPYGLADGALDVAPVANDGPPRNNITRLSGTSTTVDPAGTYEFSDTNAWRVVTGWTAGTANDFFDANGVPIPFTGQQAIDSGIGPRLYCGLKGIAGYTVDQDAAANAKIIRILKVPSYIDTLYWSDSAEMDWSASNE